MLNSIKTFLRHLLTGTAIYVIIVAGGTYYIQKSLILVKTYNPYIHWAVILVAIPVIAGVAHRLSRVNHPMLNVFCGSLITTLILYPQYKKLWAVPPATTDILIYIIIVFGIGFFATQPMKATFMMAFRMGRYSIQKFSKHTASPGKSSKSGKKRSYNNGDTQPIYSNHGQALAMMELVIGICSLGLSIFSVFFLGHS